MTVAVAMANKSKNENKNGHKNDAQRRTLHTLPNTRTVYSAYLCTYVRQGRALYLFSNTLCWYNRGVLSVMEEQSPHIFVTVKPKIC